MKKLSLYQMVKIALLAAILCILGPISFPLAISPVPISLGILGIALAVVILPTTESVISILIYILLGLVGLPVFSKYTGGFGVLAGPTGGYIIGYILLALIAGIIIKKTNRNIVFMCLGMLLGLAVCYAFGTAWLAVAASMTFGEALAAGVIPFIPVDLIKFAIAIIVGLPVHKAIQKFS